MSVRLQFHVLIGLLDFSCWSCRIGLGVYPCPCLFLGVLGQVLVSMVCYRMIILFTFVTSASSHLNEGQISFEKLW